MISWEYKSIEVKVIVIEKVLNELGKDGWELIYLGDVPGCYRAILKRQTSVLSALGI